MGYLFLSIAFNMISQFLYKSIANRQNDFIWYIVFSSGLLFGGVNAFFFTKALKNINMSIAYPIFSGACIAIVGIMSYLIFREKINAYNIFGSITVVIGIILLLK